MNEEPEAAMWSPSELPGGVSSVAEADAEADAEGDMPSWMLPSYRLALVKGFGKEEVEVRELAEAVTEGFF